MLKWCVHSKEGRPAILGFGLEARNLELLKRGAPIIARVSIGGAKVDVVIHYGETADEMLKELKESGIKLPDGAVVPHNVN
jgi:hypothetical protein